jgi:cell division protein FtsQ
MTARIARGSAPRGKAPARGSGRGKVKGRKGSGDIVADVVRRISGWIFLVMLVAVALAALLVLRVPQMIGATVGELIGEMGFSVKHVEIKGAVHVPKLEVYNIAFDQPSAGSGRRGFRGAFPIRWWSTSSSGGQPRSGSITATSR